MPDEKYVVSAYSFLIGIKDFVCSDDYEQNINRRERKKNHLRSSEKSIIL